MAHHVDIGISAFPQVLVGKRTWSIYDGVDAPPTASMCQSGGVLLERTIAYRPFPALKIFRDRLFALNAGRVPDDMWDYPKATETQL